MEIRYIVGAFLALLLIRDFSWGPAHIKTVDYSEFQQLLDQGKV